MSTPLPGNSSQTARLLLGAPSYVVGWQEPVYVKSPAAGADWKYTVDGRYYERLISARYVFTASAVVANRTIVLDITDANGVIIGEAAGSAAITANAVYHEFFSTSAPDYAYNPASSVYHWFPDLLLPPGWSVQSVTTGIDVGDQYSSLVLLVQRYPSDIVSISAVG